MQHISCWRQSGSLPSFPCLLTVGLRVFVNLATLKQMWSGNNYSAAVKPSSFVLDTFSCCHFSWPSWVCLVSFDTPDGQLNPSSWWRKASAGVLEVLPVVILLGPQVELLWDLGAGATFLRRGVIDYTVTPQCRLLYLGSFPSFSSLVVWLTILLCGITVLHEISALAPTAWLQLTVFLISRPLIHTSSILSFLRIVIRNIIIMTIRVSNIYRLLTMCHGLC